MAVLRIPGSWKIPLHLVTACGATALLLALALTLAWNSQSNIREVLLSSVDETVARASSDVSDKVQAIFAPPQSQVDFWSQHEIIRARSLEQRLKVLPYVRAMFGTYAHLDAFYVAWPNGEFVLFRPLHSARVRQLFKAPEGAALLVQARTLQASGQISGAFLYFDEAGRLLSSETRADYQFDPRERPWYQQTRTQMGAVMTPPYVFYSTRSVGTTVAQAAAGGVATVGVDVTLEALRIEADKLRLTERTQVAIVDRDARFIARDQRFDEPSYEQASAVMPDIDETNSPALVLATRLQPGSVERVHQLIGGEDWELVSIPVKTNVSGQALRVVMAIPHQDLFKSARKLLRQQLWVTLLLIALSVPAGYWLTQRVVTPLRRAIRETQAVAAFDFSPSQQASSRIAEVDLLSSATEQMKTTMARFLGVSAALNSETQLDRLLKVVLDDVAETVKARSGALYLFEDGDWTLLRSQHFARASAQADYPQSLSIENDRDHPGVRAMTSRRSYVGSSTGVPLVAVPLETLSKEFVGALLLELSEPLKSGAGGAETSRDPQLAFIEALSSTAAVAIETRHLVDSQKQLLEALIQLLAGAIDAKSPYTGGHCQRVPELTKMLVRAAHDSEDAVWKEFRLEEADWEAVHVGAWLHDCGKVTTPEYVVDKATKLETIHNRIHEIRTRFEVLKRDAEINYWRTRAEGVPEQEAWLALRSRWHALDADFAFVAECNIGGEFMDDSKLERLRQIAALPWMRTLDDRLGLSREELRAVANVPPRPLPATESVLADKLEHLVERLSSEQAVENSLGFKVTPPRYKFNRGELYNLMIRRGTLTEEERYIINDHIVQTIQMLEKLPFPKHLRGVPEIAGGHHERMDGRGYPKGLTREQMSVPARIMAIADVFEALTAADRPYKEAKTLSVSLKIMARMVVEHHLDGELFALFLRSGVYRDYSERFLLPEQLDEVDVESLLVEAGVVT